MFGAFRRIQRREFRDYQPVFMLLSSLDIIDEPTRRLFMCINGPVWHRYNEATKGSVHRRLTVLFLGSAHNGFEELLFVGCDWIRRRTHQATSLWTDHPMCTGLDDGAVRALCIDLAGRSVLTLEVLQHLRETAGSGLVPRIPLHEGLVASSATPMLS